MACMKCGSDWVTLKGKDMVSCPECCKQQRCKARKQGRLPAVQHKGCERCGQKLIVRGSAVAASRFCDDCRLPAKGERRKRWAESNRKEATRRRRVCRTLACFMADVRTAMSAQSAASAKCQKTLDNPPCICRNCSKPFVSDPRHASRFCSWQCCVAFCEQRTCETCGCMFTLRVTGRNARSKRKRPECKQCVKSRWLKTPAGRRFRKKEEHRTRCRKYGVPYDPSVKSRLVFERDNYICHVCGQQTLMMFAWAGSVPDERSPTIDHHPYPLSAGISGHEWHNVRCACWGCNVRKGAKIDPVAAVAAGLDARGGQPCRHV